MPRIRSNDWDTYEEPYFPTKQDSKDEGNGDRVFHRKRVRKQVKQNRRARKHAGEWLKRSPNRLPFKQR